MYIYDLASTHGTYLNKKRIPPSTFIHWPIGSLVRFGESTRQFVLQKYENEGPIKVHDFQLVERNSSQNQVLADPVGALRRWLEDFGEQLVFEKKASQLDDSKDDDLEFEKVNLTVKIAPLTSSFPEEGLTTQATGKSWRDAEVAVCAKVCNELISYGEFLTDQRTENTEWDIWKRTRKEELEDEDEGLDYLVDFQSKKIKIKDKETYEALLTERELLINEIVALSNRPTSKNPEILPNKTIDQLDELDNFMAQINEQRVMEDEKSAMANLMKVQEKLKKVSAILNHLESSKDV